MSKHPTQPSRHGVGVLTLFASASTLVCCAMPALLVTLGAGATLAGLVSTVPELVLLSEYKAPVFVSALALLTINGVLQWRAHNAVCPLNLSPAQVTQCERSRKISRRIYLLSVCLFALGAWFAFVQPYLFL